MARNNKHLTDNGLEEPYSAGPTRPNRFNLTMTRIDEDIVPPRKWIWGFVAEYAARRTLDLLISDRDVKWVDDNTIIINGKLKVTSDKLPSGLSDFLEYELTPAQLAWDIPRDRYAIAASMFVERVPQYFDAPIAAEEKRRVAKDAPKTPKPDKPTRAAKPGDLIDLPQVIADITPKMDAKEARTILRKHSQKPDHGSWAWPASDVPAIVKLLKEHRK